MGLKRTAQQVGMYKALRTSARPPWMRAFAAYRAAVAIEGHEACELGDLTVTQGAKFGQCSAPHGAVLDQGSQLLDWGKTGLPEYCLGYVDLPALIGFVITSTLDGAGRRKARLQVFPPIY
jgi:hypothetical protein